MKEQELFDQIKEVSADAAVQPTDAVWDRLALRLDAEVKESAPPPRSFTLFSWRSLSIAASIVVLVGAYALLNNLNSARTESTAIQLEDLHTLEVNPKYNIPAAGDAATIPTVRNAKVIMTSYKSVDEGDSNKELIRKQTGSQEFGLG